MRNTAASSRSPPDRLAAPRGLVSTAVGPEAFVEEALRWSPGEISPEEIAAAPPGPEGGAARILLADDNADMRDYVTRLLRGRWSVETVADGATALARARETLPDLILSDIMMPGLDGYQLLQALRADERTRAVPVIFLSARAGEEERVEGLSAGADDYLVKPFSARELLARVGTHLELARLRREAERSWARLYSEAEVANRSKDEFLAMLGHELRNPLAPIVTALQLMELRGDDTLRRERTIIERQVRHLTHLVDDLLDVSRHLDRFGNDFRDLHARRSTGRRGGSAWASRSSRPSSSCTAARSRRTARGTAGGANSWCGCPPRVPPAGPRPPRRRLRRPPAGRTRCGSWWWTTTRTRPISWPPASG
jgi:DNA-binding response OmpR family regulator